MKSLRFPNYLLSIATATLIAGCGDDFDPPSLLNNTRILALHAAPLEAGPNEIVSLNRSIYLAPATTITEEKWSFCPLTQGSSRGYACAIAACETTLAADAQGQVRYNPTQLVADCLSAAQNTAGAIAENSSVPQQLPSKLSTLLRYIVTDNEGLRRESVLELPLHTSPITEARNRPLVIKQVEFLSADGQVLTALPSLRLGEQIDVRVLIEESSLDNYADDSGRTRQEEPIVSFYADAGRFKNPRAAGLVTQMTWTAEKIARPTDQASIYIVARDLRGGQTVAGPYLVAILSDK